MKIGDKVKVTSSGYDNKELGVGVTGIIVVENDDRSCFGVLLDSGYLPPEFAYLNGTPSWAYHPHELEVVA